MLELINQNLPALFTIIGAVLGYFANYFTQKSNFKMNSEREDKKALEEHRERAFKFYNEIIKFDGEVMVIGKDHFQFILNENEYTKIRDLLYRDFHLLEKDWRKDILELDERLKSCRFFEEIDEADNDFLTDRYTNLIKKIRNRIDEF